MVGFRVLIVHWRAGSSLSATTKKEDDVKASSEDALEPRAFGDHA